MKELNQTKKRTILHSDVNNFFASVECAIHPEFKNLPVAVTGDAEKRNGVILAKNEIAKKFGVQTGQVIIEARALCPNLVCLPPHYDIYEEISQSLHEVYLNYTNFVEPLGLDECWLDVTGCEKYLNKTGKQIADEIRSIVKKKFDITVSVGVSFSKIFAKLASDLKKPNFTTIIDIDNYKELTYDLPLNSVIGIGKRLTERFKNIGVNTIGDFVKLDRNYIKHVMGENGMNLLDDLLAVRYNPVLDYYHLPPPKSIGNGTTTITDITREKELQNVIYFLAQKVSSRLIRRNLLAQGICLTIKDNTLKTYHKGMKIPLTNSINDLAKFGVEISKRIYNFSRPIRAVRLKVFNLSSHKYHQMNIFEYGKRDLSQTINHINKKYGKIFLASDMSSYINRHPH